MPILAFGKRRCYDNPFAFPLAELVILAFGKRRCYDNDRVSDRVDCFILAFGKRRCYDNGTALIPLNSRDFSIWEKAVL